MGHFGLISRGNFVHGIVIYSVIAFSRKRQFVKNKTNIFVENPDFNTEIFVILIYFSMIR